VWSVCVKVVFLTALFYLLASSSHSYKPVDLFTSLSLSVCGLYGLCVWSVCVKVVFLTALFYLLASSSHSYKPVDLFTSLSPSADELAFGNAFEEAIG